MNTIISTTSYAVIYQYFEDGVERLCPAQTHFPDGYEEGPHNHSAFQGYYLKCGGANEARPARCVFKLFDSSNPLVNPMIYRVRASD